MKALKKFLIGLLIFLLVIILIVAGGYFFVKGKYGIDLVEVIGHLKNLSTEVNKDEQFTNQPKDEDMVSAKNKFNAELTNFITYSDGKYDVSTDGVTSMHNDIVLNGKEVGAIVDNLFLSKIEDENGIKSMTLAGVKLNYELVQVEFVELNEKTVTFETVLDLDVKGLKSSMTSFPLNLVSGFLPDHIFAASYIDVTKGESPNTYTVVSKSLAMNKCDGDSTKSLFDIIGKFVSGISIETINNIIGKTVFDALVGPDDSNKGLVRNLGSLNASDFDFVKSGENINFVIKAGA